MAALSAEQVAQIASQAGATGETLVRLVAIAKRESGYQPTAHRTDSDPSRLSGDRGLFQINSVWDQQLMAAGIIKSKQDLFDPVVNAKAAMYVLGKQGWAAWGMGSNGWQAGGDPLRGTNVAEAQAAVQRAQAQGLLTQPYSASGGTTGTSGGNVALPSDVKLVRAGGSVWAIFEPSPGVQIRYGVSDPAMLVGRTVTDLTSAQFAQQYNKSINAGNAKELESTTQTFGTFRGQWDSIISQVLGSNNPARNDPGVLRVIAEFAGRPDMSTAELQNKLRGTKYWQQRTEQELEWNSLSEAERVKRRQETAAAMSQTWFEMTGENRGAAYFMRYAHTGTIASGKMSYSEWTEAHVKPYASKNTESPWSRQVRTEGENQRQRGVDVENTVLNLRQTLEKWGLQWSEATLADWGRQIMEKRSSDDDFMNTVKDQAMVKYGRWKKNRDMETLTEAAPWVDTYSRVMEQQGTLFTSDVAQALNQGMDLWDFEQSLKKKPAWGETKNGREAITTAVGELGSMLGFAA